MLLVEFARSMMRPLYGELYAPKYFAILEESGNRSLEWRARTLRIIDSEIAREWEAVPDCVLYTDSRAIGSKLAAVLFKTANGKLKISDEITKGPRAKFRIERFAQPNLAYELELLAIIGYIAQNKIRFRDRAINIYVYNDNPIAALIKAGSNTEIIARTVCHFWG